MQARIITILLLALALIYGDAMRCPAADRVGGARSVRKGQWSWPLPPTRYGSLTVFERAFYDKAAKLLQQNEFRAAASEFEKFKLQMQDTAGDSMLAYLSLMIGYCLNQAKDRGAAIRAFDEVLDFFPDEADEAGAALYFKGQALLDNGDTRKGLEVMKRLADDPSYQTHPLAAGALNRLADNFLKNKQDGDAVKYWQQAYTTFAPTNPHEAGRARQSLSIYFLQRSQPQRYESIRVDKNDPGDPKLRSQVALELISDAGPAFDMGQWGQLRQKERTAAMLAFFDWYKAQKPHFEKAGRLWEYYDRGIWFLSNYLGDKAAREQFFNEVIVAIKKIEDPTAANNRYAGLVDALCNITWYTQAEAAADSIRNDPGLVALKRIHILLRQQKWSDAAKACEQLEKGGAATYSVQAKRIHADLCRERLNDQATAIKLYGELDQPPGTLWLIADSQRRGGMGKDTYTTLNTIENSFPDQAAAAAWRRCQYLEEDGQREELISACRRILKMYKGTPYSSYAHQKLEQMGIDKTGGAVTSTGN